MGESDYISTGPNGTYFDQAADGNEYVFNAAGALQSVTSSLDDTKPAAMVYSYSSDGLRVTTMTDPATGRHIDFKYATTVSPPCANAPSGFDAQGPDSSICEIDYWDGTNTKFYYSSGQLARIVDPGSELTDFGYATLFNGMTVLHSVRDPLANDWLLAGNPDSTNNLTLISYNTYTGAVSAIERPTVDGTSNTASTRQKHSYTYVSGSEAKIDVAGITPNVSAAFFADVKWDAAGRTVESTDITGAKTVTVWSKADNVISTVRDARQVGATAPLSDLALETTNKYDQFDRLTDTYGPAPAYCFNAVSSPDQTPTPGTACTGPTPAHKSVSYDNNFTGGNTGLAATYWTTPNFTGGTKYHTFVNGSSGSDVSTGGWSAKPTQLGSATDWSVRLTGRITLGAGTYYFNGASGLKERVYVDDKLVYDAIPDDVVASSYIPLVNTDTGAGAHRIRVDASFSSGSATGGVTYRLSTASADSDLVYASPIPRYELATSATTDDGTTNSPATTVSTSYGSNPAYGIAQSTTQDPAGSAPLTTSDAFESFGSGYMRKLTHTLPNGQTTNYGYYTTPGATIGGTAFAGVTGSVADIPTDSCATHTVGTQGGLLATDTTPAGATGSAITIHNIYDQAGRVQATWQNSETTPTCINYDARGRVINKVVPAYNGVAGYAYTYNYAVGSNPLVSSVSGGAGSNAITTVIDMLGQVTSYTDAWGRTTTYLYDQAGHQYESDTTGNGDSRSTTFNNLNQVTAQNMGYDNTQLNPVANNVQYNAAGNMTSVDYPSGTGTNGNGTTAGFEYDIYGHAKKVSYNKGATPLASDTQTFSQQGRIMSDSLNDNSVTYGSTYGYDTFGRLTSASVNGTSYAYGFGTPSCSGTTGSNANANKNSDRTSFTKGATTYAYCYDNADRLLSTTDATYSGTPTYDTHGNTTNLGGNTMTYDQANQHVSTTTGGTTITYKRDALGRIIERDTTASNAIALKGQTSANNGTGSTSLTLSKPTASATGDVLLAHVAVNGGSGVTITTPTGWTLVNSANQSTNVRSSVYAHVVASGDPSSWSFTLSTSKVAAGGIGDYSGVNTTTPVNASTYHTSGSSGTWHIAGGVTTTVANTMNVIVSAISSCTTVTPASGQTQNWSQCNSGSAIMSYSTEATQTTAGLTADVNNISTGNGWDATQMVALNPVGGSTNTATLYGFSGSSDNPVVTMDASKTVLDKTISLIGGVSRVVHYGSGGTQTYTWSYPNLHGDIVFTADQTSTKTGGTYLYDPFGQSVLGGTADELSGNLDYGYLGKQQRGTEHEGSLNVIEMGARQYVPGLGRFLSVDPIEGGSANDYDYVDQDSVNGLDLDGRAKKKAPRPLTVNPRIWQDPFGYIHVDGQVFGAYSTTMGSGKMRVWFGGQSIANWGFNFWGTGTPPGGTANQRTYACRVGHWSVDVNAQRGREKAGDRTSLDITSCPRGSEVSPVVERSRARLPATL